MNWQPQRSEILCATGHRVALSRDLTKDRLRKTMVGDLDGLYSNQPSFVHGQVSVKRAVRILSSAPIRAGLSRNDGCLWWA
jgi:hypothetical protein